MKTKEALQKLIREKFSELTPKELESLRKVISNIKKRKGRK